MRRKQSATEGKRDWLEKRAATVENAIEWQMQGAIQLY